MVSVGGSQASDGFGGSKAHGREELIYYIFLCICTMNNTINAENKQEQRSHGQEKTEHQ